MAGGSVPSASETRRAGAPPQRATVSDDAPLVAWRRDREPAPAPLSASAGEEAAVCLLFDGYLAGAGGPIAGAAAARAVAAAYRVHGSALAGALPGAWCAVLWDRRRSALVAATDAAALCPLYLRLDGPRVLLSTSLERLLAAAPRHVDADVLAWPLAGVAPPAGRTPWHGVRALAPGGCWTILVGSETQSVGWAAGPRPPFAGDAEQSAARLVELLDEVVPQHLAGLAAGITLSSGLDSSTLAAVAAAGGGPRPVALAWTSPELPEADESAGSGEVARHLGLATLWVDAAGHWPLRQRLELRPPACGPFATSYPGLWRETCRAARESGLSTVVTGSSGDHLFGGGVAPYADDLLTARWGRLLRQLRRHREVSDLGRLEMLRRFVAAPILRSYLPRWRDRVGRPQPWLGERARRLLAAAAPPPAGRGLPARRERSRLLADHGLGHALHQLGDLARAEGVSLRHPLLDVRLLDLALRVPPHHVFDAGIDKTILRRAMAGRLPASTLARRRRIVPTALAHRGFRERETATMWSLLTDMRTAALGLVDEAEARRSYRRYLDGDGAGVRVWWAASVEAWLRHHG